VKDIKESVSLKQIQNTEEEIAKR